MNRIANVVIALALVVIAINVTYLNIPKAVQKPSADIKEQVLPVVGRVCFPFDGMGATVGFLVKDGEEFKIVRYDEGSLAANETFQPKFLTMVRLTNGKTIFNPLQVTSFN